MSMNAIETKYKGCRFRSRLEARWAVFFDALGVKWEYEKEGYPLPSGPYLPDFWLPYGPFGDPNLAGAGFWVEIKPIPPTDREMQLMAELAKHTNHRSYIFSGMPDNGCGAVVFQHWHGGQPKSVPLVTGSLWILKGEVQIVDGETGGHFCAPFPDGYREKTREDIFAAFDAARSARFEHGEQG